MLRIILLCTFLLSANIFSSCKKESNSAPANLYVKCDLNGVTTTLNITAEVLWGTYFDGSGTGYTAIINGYNSGATQGFNLILHESSPFVTGKTYTETSPSTVGNYLNYFPSPGPVYSSKNNSPGTSAYFRCTFTSINNDYAQGNFEATIYMNMGGGIYDKIVATNGSFAVKTH